VSKQAQRIYRVETPQGTRLIRAIHPAAAIRHAAKGITAEVASQQDLVDLVTTGCEVEETDGTDD